ncbi:MAG: hypothetical protein ACRCVD_10605, partial [Halioglobus sp.]
RLLRRLRTWHWSGFKLARFGPEAQDRVLKPLGLRRPFNKPLRWDQRSLALVQERILPDSLRFLEAWGKPADFWRI